MTARIICFVIGVGFALGFWACIDTLSPEASHEFFGHHSLYAFGAWFCACMASNLLEKAWGNK